MSDEISPTTNDIYARRRVSLLWTGQNYPSNQWRIIENMYLHSRDQSKKRKSIRFYIIAILSEKKDPMIKKKLINMNIYIAS